MIGRSTAGTVERGIDWLQAGGRMKYTVKEGNYTASDLAKMKDSAFKDGYLETENKKVYDYSAQ